MEVKGNLSTYLLQALTAFLMPKEQHFKHFPVLPSMAFISFPQYITQWLEKPQPLMPFSGLSSLCLLDGLSFMSVACVILELIRAWPPGSRAPCCEWWLSTCLAFTQSWKSACQAWPPHCFCIFLDSLCSLLYHKKQTFLCLSTHGEQSDAPLYFFKGWSHVPPGERFAQKGQQRVAFISASFISDCFLVFLLTNCLLGGSMPGANSHPMWFSCHSVNPHSGFDFKLVSEGFSLPTFCTSLHLLGLLLEAIILFPSQPIHCSTALGKLSPQQSTGAGLGFSMRVWDIFHRFFWATASI